MEQEDFLKDNPLDRNVEQIIKDPNSKLSEIKKFIKIYTLESNFIVLLM